MRPPELIERFLDGDRDAVQRIQDWIRGTLVGYRAKLGDEIGDLQQEILVQLVQAFRDRRYRGQSKLKTYVKSFAHHKAIDRLRALTRHPWTDLAEIDPVDGETSAFERLAQEQQVEIAFRVASQMPQPCRELWQMLGKGWSYRQMSRQLGIAEGTLRARVMRCRRQAVQLRRNLLENAHNKTAGRSTK